MIWSFIAFLGAAALIFAIQYLVHAHAKPDEEHDINRMLINALVLAGGFTLLTHMTAG